MDNKENINKGARVGILTVVTAGILWGMIGIFVRPLGNIGLTSADIAFLRSFVAFVLFAVYLLIFRREAFRIKLKDIWCFLGTGMASIAFFNVCYFAAIEMTSMAVAAILLYTSPVFVLLMSAVCFREKLTPVKLISVVLVVVGCVFVSGVIGSDTALGLPALFLGLGAGFGYALYSIFSRCALSRGYRTDTINLYSFLFSASVLVFFADHKVIVHVASSEALAVPLVVMLALFASLLPYLLYTFGLSRVENGIAAIVVGIEPVVAAITGILFLHDDAPSVFTVIGILLVLTAILLPNIRIKRK